MFCHSVQCVDVKIVRKRVIKTSVHFDNGRKKSKKKEISHICARLTSTEKKGESSSSYEGLSVK